jgi:hypothetical protein
MIRCRSRKNWGVRADEQGVRAIGRDPREGAIMVAVPDLHHK